MSNWRDWFGVFWTLFLLSGFVAWAMREPALWLIFGVIGLMAVGATVAKARR